MEYVVLAVFAVFGIAWLVDELCGRNRPARSSRYYPYSESNDEVLPSGYRRSDYHRYGFMHPDIELLGLDQPGAPDPFIAGMITLDILDEDMDGEIDFDW